MASGGGKATASSWAAAMSVSAGTVEALKEQHAGLCRWDCYALLCVQQRFGGTNAAAGNGAYGKISKKAVQAAGGAARRKARQEQEDELRTVMYLSNWGPNN